MFNNKREYNNRIKTIFSKYLKFPRVYETIFIALVFRLITFVHGDFYFRINIFNFLRH